MRALVTGATGFIGSHIVDHLLARGDSVRAIVRSSRKAHHLVQQGVQLVQSDLCDPATLSTAVHGVDVVYHAAALGKGNPAEAILATNVNGTENLLTACAEKAVSRFVFISSVSVYAQSLEPLIDEDAPQGGMDVYGQSKSAAEEIVRCYAQTSGTSYNILRPCRVYGERDNRYTTRLLRSMHGPILVVGSGGYPYYNLVHVSDVAAAAVLAGTCSEATGQSFNITDGHGASRQEIAEMVQQITSRKKLILPIWTSLVKCAYAMHSSFQAHRTRTKPSTQWRQLFIGQRYDISKARYKLGYEPQVDLQEGLRRALAWCKEHIVT